MNPAPHDPEKDRRPIAARGLPVFQRLAGALARAGVSPNAISIAGMACGLAAGLAFAATLWWPHADRALLLAGAALVQLRLLANLLDGMVAIAGGRASRVGELYNEAPDRVSDAGTLVGFGYAAGAVPWLGFVAALLAVMTAYVRTLARAAGAPSDFRGPMAKQQRMAVLTLVALYLALAPAAWRPAWEPFPGRPWGLPALALALIAAGCVVTIIRRLRAAAASLRKAAA